MDKHKSHNYLFVSIFVILILLMSQGLSFVGWTAIPMLKNARYAVMAMLPFVTLFVWRNINKGDMHFRKYVLYFIAMTIFTFCLRNLVYGGGLGNGLERNLLFGMSFCVYFLLHFYKVKEADIIFSLTLIGTIVFIINIYQQFNPDSSLFGIMTEDERTDQLLTSIARQRNGIYRFNLISQLLPFFLTCYYWYKVTSKFKPFNLALFLMFVVLLYLTLTRMFLFALAIVIIYTLYKTKGITTRRISYFLAFVGAMFLIVYSDVLFLELFNSESDAGYSVSARQEALPFILARSFENPILFITGHGYPDILWKWGGQFGYWWNDLGVFGQIFPYGIIWFVVYFALVKQILLKFSYCLPMYIKMYVFGLLSICYMMPSYSYIISAVIWSCILYIADLYISKYQSDSNYAITDN